MSEFKIGDKVTPISVDRYTQYDRQIMKNLIGRTMIVSATSTDEKQREIVHAGIPGDFDRRWYSEDLRFAASSPVIEPPKYKSDFRLCDYVVPLNIDNELYKEDRSFMRDKVLRVVSISRDSELNISAGLFMDLAGSMKWNKEDLRHATKEEIETLADPVEFKDGDLVVFIDTPSMVMTIRNERPETDYPFNVKETWVSKYGVDYWSDEVSIRHATKEEIEAAQKWKPRRGDLVIYNGSMWLVIADDANSDGEYFIASMTSGPEVNYAKQDELTLIGSIRKKVKKIKKAMEEAK